MGNGYFESEELTPMHSSLFNKKGQTYTVQEQGVMTPCSKYPTTYLW